jgi:putative transcriptional regulator
MAIQKQMTDEWTLAELGKRLARHRLNRNLTQDQLAREAGVSKRTVVRLENGESSQLTNLLRILRALGLLGNLDGLVPAPLASPVEALKAKVRERRRASPSAQKLQPGSEWTWGDDTPTSRGEL